MDEQVTLLLLAGCALSVAGGYITWKNADFFIAKRELHNKSRYAILKKRIKMSLKVAGVILLLTIIIASAITQKARNNNGTQKAPNSAR